jgi:hypothetical protein
MCSYKVAEESYLEQKEPIYTFKTMTCIKRSFQNLSQFWQGNYVLYGHASKIDGFLLSDTCVSSM